MPWISNPNYLSDQYTCILSVLITRSQGTGQCKKKQKVGILLRQTKLSLFTQENMPGAAYIHLCYKKHSHFLVQNLEVVPLPPKPGSHIQRLIDA